MEEVWVAQPTIEDKRYDELAAAIEENDIKERVLYPGDKIPILIRMTTNRLDEMEVLDDESRNRLQSLEKILKKYYSWMNSQFCAHSIDILGKDNITKAPEKHLEIK